MFKKIQTLKKKNLLHTDASKFGIGTELNQKYQ